MNPAPEKPSPCNWCRREGLENCTHAPDYNLWAACKASRDALGAPPIEVLTICDSCGTRGHNEYPCGECCRACEGCGDPATVWRETGYALCAVCAAEPGEQTQREGR